jgi:hypothetical protein
MRVAAYPQGFFYGAFSDTTSQAIALANTPQTITMNTTDLVDGVYLGSPSSRVYCPKSAKYNFQFSLQLQSSSASTKTVAIWARINGVDVPNTGTDITISGSGTELVAAWNFFLPMKAGQYFELVWASGDTNVSLYTATAQTSPYARPAIPSVIMTVSEVGNNAS